MLPVRFWLSASRRRPHKRNRAVTLPDAPVDLRYYSRVHRLSSGLIGSA